MLSFSVSWILDQRILGEVQDWKLSWGTKGQQNQTHISGILEYLKYTHPCHLARKLRRILGLSEGLCMYEKVSSAVEMLGSAIQELSHLIKFL